MLSRRTAPIRGWALGAVLLVATSYGTAAAQDSFYETVKDKPASERREALQIHIDEGNITKELYFHLGNAAYESGDPAGGVTAFEKAVELDPTYFKAIVNLALMYDEMQNYPKAIEVFEQARALQPENPEVWSHLGNTYYAQRKYPKAMELYRKALVFQPDAPHALYSMGVAFADAGLFREAVNYWSRVAKVEPDTELGTSAAENVELLQKYLIP